MNAHTEMTERSPEELWNAIQDNAPDLYFCPHPFEHLYNDNLGHWALCCRAYPLDHLVGNTTPEEHWKHPLMEEIRREMLSGNLNHVRKYCWKCLKMEKDGLTSPRQQLNAALLKKKAPAKSKVLAIASRMTSNPDEGITFNGRTLELKLRVYGNYCQLHCYMCSPLNSTSRRDELSEIRDGRWLGCFGAQDRPDFFESEEHYDRFIDSAMRLLPYVRKIKITGGEPFLLPRHFKFLEKIVATEHARKIRLSYDTNMARFHLGSDKVFGYLKRFKAVTLAVSIDNLGARNDYIRYGSEFNAVMANVEKARTFPGINVVVSCATGMLNAGDVHDIADFFHQRGLVAKFNMCVINWPVFLQARHLPDALKENYLAKLESSPHRAQFSNVIRMIKQPRDEAQYQIFLEYLGDLDRHRGTSWLDLWPEFRLHARPVAADSPTPVSPSLPQPV